ncbi:MAG: alpha/beta hydrolase [Planctomycetaceae bacterium]|nr:alpha/beta hydrolase [Planctomycetaceae bacterium]
MRWLVTRGVICYLAICLILTIWQRDLIYHPKRTEKLSVSESYLPKGMVHEISYETADGLTINGWHLLRKGEVHHTPEACQASLDEGSPVVLFFHGNAGDRRGRVSYCDVFTNAGADVFVIDYRGFADSPGSPTETGLYEDARGLWNYATEDRGIDPSRILIFGESLGGGVAVQLAHEVCQAGTPPAGLILRSTFSCIADAAGSHYPWIPTHLLVWDRFPSCETIGDVTCPVLVLHGTEDRIVPYELGQKLFAAVPESSANDVPKQFITLEGADHNRLLDSHRNEFTQAVEQFLTSLPTADMATKGAE